MPLIPQDGTPIPDDDVRVLMCERDGLVDVYMQFRPEVPLDLLTEMQVGRRTTFPAHTPIHDGKSARLLGADLTLRVQELSIRGAMGPDEGATMRLKGTPCGPEFDPPPLTPEQESAEERLEAYKEICGGAG